MTKETRGTRLDDETRRKTFDDETRQKVLDDETEKLEDTQTYYNDVKIETQKRKN